MKKILIIMIIVFFASSCYKNLKKDDSVIIKKDNNADMDSDKKEIQFVPLTILQGMSETANLPDDSFQVVYAEKINEKTVKIDVKYGGGCREHDFNLYWNERILESEPPQAHILLMHNANGDQCEALIKESYYIDISKFSNGIYVKIQNNHGFEKTFEYFPDKNIYTN